MIKIIDQFAYHYYNGNHSEFTNIRTMTHEEVEMSIPGSDVYVKARSILEDMMISSFIRKGGNPKINYAHYFSVNSCSLISDKYDKPHCVKIPISCFEKNTISFTYYDSFRAFFFSKHPTKRKIYTLDEIQPIIDKYSFPSGSFIEMQLWDNPYKYSGEMIVETLNNEPQYLLHDIYGQNQINEFMKYRDLIVSENHFHPKGIHGVKHAERVLFHCVNLANVNKLTDEQKDILYLAAVYHDIGRESDGSDIMHGYKSYEKLEKLNLLNIQNVDKKNTIKYIIENHCIEDNKRKDIYVNSDSSFLLDLFKDADALDRIRISDLNKEYLRNYHSKRMIHIAWRLINTNSFNDNSK